MRRSAVAPTINAPGVLYTNDGTDNPPAVLGSLSVLPSRQLSRRIFVFPTQVWRKRCLNGSCETTDFVEGQSLGPPRPFVDLSGTVPTSNGRSGYPADFEQPWQ